MAKYVYPAIFETGENGGYSVFFPDLEGCYTCGDDLKDALFMAEDVLAFVLYDYETLTVPEWLNEAAMRKNINFSQVLQEALLQKINM